MEEWLIPLTPRIARASLLLLQLVSRRAWLHLIGDPGAGAGKVANGATFEAAPVPRPLLPLHEVCSVTRLLHEPAPVGHATESGALLQASAHAVQLAYAGEGQQLLTHRRRTCCRICWASFGDLHRFVTEN